MIQVAKHLVAWLTRSGRARTNRLTAVHLSPHLSPHLYDRSAPFKVSVDQPQCESALASAASQPRQADGLPPRKFSDHSPALRRFPTSTPEASHCRSSFERRVGRRSLCPGSHTPHAPCANRRLPLMLRAAVGDLEEVKTRAAHSLLMKATMKATCVCVCV